MVPRLTPFRFRDSFAGGGTSHVGHTIVGRSEATMVPTTHPGAYTAAPFGIVALTAMTGTMVSRVVPLGNA